MLVTYEELFAAAANEARSRELPVVDDAPPENRTQLIDGLRLHFLDWGGDAPTPMLLLHGALVTPHVWDFLGLEMRQRYHVYAVSLRGHGDSEWAADGDYTRTRMAADVVQLIEQLGLDDIVLIGHSLGGSIATLVAAEVPGRVQALGLIDSTLLPNPGPGPGAMAALVNGPDVFPTLQAFAQHAAGFNPRRRTEQLMVSLQWNARQRADGSWTWKYDPALRQRRSPEFERVWSALETLDCPKLFVRAGENSHATEETVERLRGLRDVKIVEVPRAAHNIMGDNPHGFSLEVGQFLASLPATRRSASN